MEVHLAKDGSRFEGEFKEDRASGLQAIGNWGKKIEKVEPIKMLQDVKTESSNNH